MSWTKKNEYVDKIKNKDLSIGVIGLGYVGLQLAVSFADKGFNVYGYDVDRKKVESVNSGVNYIEEEKWISEKLKKLGGKKIIASTEIEESGDNDFICIAVPTPTKGGTPIYEYVEAASKSVAKNLKRGALVSLESTVGPGTTKYRVKPLLESGSGLKAGKDFGLVFSPERLWPGEKNMTDIPKIVGGEDELSAELASNLYEQIVPSVHTVGDTIEAELVKLFENTQRDINIAAANDFARICDVYGVDVKRIFSAGETKWNWVKVYPGCGVGGHCIPHSPLFLYEDAKKRGYRSELIKMVRHVNDSMPSYTVKKGLNILRKHGKKPYTSKVAILGLSYKSNTSDCRSSPSEAMVKELRKRGVKNIVAYDPMVKKVDWVETKNDIQEALTGSDLIILSTFHDALKDELTPQNVAKLAPKAVFVDGRNIFDKKMFESYELDYVGIGR